MAGWQTGDSEIIGRRDQTSAEMVIPHPIGDDSCRERVSGIAHPLCQLAASSGGGGVRESLGWRWRCLVENPRKSRRDLGSGCLHISPQEDAGGSGLGSVLGNGECEVEGWCFCLGLLQPRFGGFFHLSSTGLPDPLSQLVEARFALGMPTGGFGGCGQRSGDFSGASAATARVLLAVAVDVSQEAEQRVVIGLRNGVELVVVATGASDAQPEEGGARRAKHVVEVVEFRRGGVIRLIVPDVQSVEASSDETGSPFRCEGRFGLEGRFGQFVTRELFSHELIVGLVAVEAVDDVVAVTPGVRLGSVALVPVALGIADQI